jgi:hypothetical protein
VSVPPSCVLARCSHRQVSIASGDTLNRDDYDAACTHTARRGPRTPLAAPCRPSCRPLAIQTPGLGTGHPTVSAGSARSWQPESGRLGVGRWPGPRRLRAPQCDPPPAAGSDSPPRRPRRRCRLQPLQVRATPRPAGGLGDLANCSLQRPGRREPLRLPPTERQPGLPRP